MGEVLGKGTSFTRAVSGLSLIVRRNFPQPVSRAITALN